MKLLKRYTLISALFLLGTAAAEETLVLQQGLNGYDGCKNLGIYDDKYPNKNYALNYTYKTARKVMISKFKCWSVDTIGVGRFALYFEVSKVPQNARVINAKLELYHVGMLWDYICDDINAWERAAFDNNATLTVYKRTEDFSEETDPFIWPQVWDEVSPGVDSTNPIDTYDFISTGPQIDSGWFDFDVTSAVSGYVTDPSTNFGFMIYLETDCPVFNSGSVQMFCRKDTNNVELRPKLTIEYDTLSVPISSNPVKNKLDFKIASLNSTGLRISTQSAFSADIMIYSVNGSLIQQIGSKYLKAKDNVINFNKKLSRGTYFVTLKGEKFSNTQKIVIHR